jgi:hypothetical protein
VAELCSRARLFLLLQMALAPIAARWRSLKDFTATDGSLMEA